MSSAQQHPENLAFSVLSFDRSRDGAARDKKFRRPFRTEDLTQVFPEVNLTEEEGVDKIPLGFCKKDLDTEVQKRFRCNPCR